SYAGLIDRAVQGATGGRASYRMLDPTNLGGAAYAFAKGRAEAAAGEFVHLLDRDSTNYINRALRSSIGDAATDGIQQSLANYYMTFVMHEMRMAGIGGQATPFRSELPAYKAGEGTYVRTAMNELVPELYMSQGRLGAARPVVIRMRSLVENLYQAMNDASHD